MLQQKQFLMDLKKHFRLNIYEVKIWTALLSRGIASAGELADISGVPRSRCYDVLETLEKKGFVIMKIGKPIKHLAVDPQAILERVKRNLKEEADEISTHMDKIKSTEEFQELELLHKSGVQHVDITTISKSIVGRTAINKHMKEIVSRAKSAIMIVSTGEGLERSAKILKPFMHNFAKKGIKVKLYAPYNKSVLKKLQNVEHVEYTPSTSFITIDNREMAFMVSNSSTAPEYEVAVWIESTFFVNAVNLLFEQSLK